MFHLTLPFERHPTQCCRWLDRLSVHYLEHCPWRRPRRGKEFIDPKSGSDIRSSSGISGASSKWLELLSLDGLLPQVRTARLPGLQRVVQALEVMLVGFRR